MVSQYHGLLCFESDKCDGHMSFMRVFPTVVMRVLKRSMLSMPSSIEGLGDSV